MAMTPEKVWEFYDALRPSKSSSESQRMEAVVLRTDPDGTGWVRLPGSDGETPIDGAVIAGMEAGDIVSVSVDGGKATVTGNATRPSVGATVVAAMVDGAVSSVSRVVDMVKDVAADAKAVAEATNQHFFTDTNGIHVTEATQEEWESSHTGANVLINSLGQLFRDGLNNLVSITSSATKFYDGVANATANVVAQFGSFGAIIGKVASSHFAQTATGATFFGTNGTDKNLSIETDNGIGAIKFNGDRSSISGFLNMLMLRSCGSSDVTDNGMITITAESEDANTASGTIGQTYLWMYSDQGNAHAELESVDGNGGMAGVLVDGKNSEVDITGDLKLVNNVLAPSYGGTGKTSLQATRSAMGLGNTTGALPVANGGTGKTTAADARAALGAAARSWTQLDTSSNDAAMTYDLSNYYEVMFVARAGTDYVGSVVLPKAHLSTTAREVYLSGGSNSSTGGRGFAVTATSTKATPAARRVDGTTTSCTWWTYAR